jgi:hypothetical protein
MTTVVLLGVDAEHLKSARDGGLGEEGRMASLGTNFWTEQEAERPENFPAGVPAYIYEVTRGLGEAVPFAKWAGTLVGYRDGSSLSAEEYDRTRPERTRHRRDPSLPLDEMEPDWAGYLMVADLHVLEEPVPLGRFWAKGRRCGPVIRHPMLAELRP